MNILILSVWGDDWDINRVVGSPENAVLICGFIEKGLKVHLIIPKEKGFTRSNIDNLLLYPMFRLPDIPKFKLLASMVRIIQYLILNISFISYGLKVSKQHSIDLIYGLSSLCSFAVYWLGRHLGKPTILKLMGVFTFYPIKKCNPIYWGLHFPEFIAYKLPYSHLFVLDDGTQGDKVATHFNVPLSRFWFYSQSIDSRLVLRVEKSELGLGLKDRLGFKSHEYIVLFVSRLVSTKGLDITLRAMKFILEKERNARLLVVGDGPTRKKSEDLAKQLGIKDYVRFVGSVRYIEVWKYYRIADIFLSTNIYSNLTLPVIEAMLSRVPVVTLDIRDTYKLVQHGKTGFLVNPSSSHLYQGIAEAVCNLLKDKELSKRISTQAQEFVLSNFPTWAERLEQEINLIKKLVY